MFYNCDERAIEIGKFLIDNQNMTVRSLAQLFGLSKTNIHTDLTVRLPRVHSHLASEVRMILEYHKQIRHLNGGEATKRKYA